MEFAWKDEGIRRITKKEDKSKREREIRKLWRECFNDPIEYENFYFNTVYKNNILYEWRDKGMLHLNPYKFSVMGKQVPLHYIVGVGTKTSERGKGVMRTILKKALEDMRMNNEPFTYLMPENFRYYRSYDFFHVSTADKTRQKWNERKNEQICYLSYKEFIEQANEKEQEIFFQMLLKETAKKATVFAIHDKTYMDLLYEEKHCQNGDVVLCFNQEITASNCVGFFAYVKNGEKNVVEQTVIKRNRRNIAVQGYFGADYQEFKSYTYMLRVVHAEEFLKLFADCFADFAEEGRRLFFRDYLLFDNRGVYTFEKKNNKIEVTKQKLEWNTEKRMGDVEMEPDELVRYIFYLQEDKVKTFFAEIV